MSFSDTYRFMAINPTLVQDLFNELLSVYGEEINDGANVVKTIGAYWDEESLSRKRAASLFDGRVCFTCLWQSDLEQTFVNHGIEGVDEISREEFNSLRAKPIVKQ